MVYKMNTIQLHEYNMRIESEDITINKTKKQKIKIQASIEIIKPRTNERYHKL